MITNKESQDEIGDNHLTANANNPVRKDAFDMPDDQKIESIKKDVENILKTLGMDLTDDKDSLETTLIYEIGVVK